MGVEESQIREPSQQLDYTRPIAREGEQQFAAIIRNRSGQDAGCIDYGLRQLDGLSDHDKQEMCDTAYALYQNICRYVGKKAKQDDSPRL